MARQTNWLDSWDPFNFKRLSKKGLKDKKTEIKEIVKAKLNALDKKSGIQHTIVLKWRKLPTGTATFRLVANITPPEERDDGGTDSVISPTVPRQP